MILCVTIETHLRIIRFQFPDETTGGENIQVPIDGAHANLRNLLTDPFVYFIRAQMGVHLFHLIEDHLPLIRHPKFSFFIQGLGLHILIGIIPILLPLFGRVNPGAPGRR